MPWVKRRNPQYSAMRNLRHHLRRPIRIGGLILAALFAGWMLASTIDHLPSLGSLAKSEE